MTDFDRANYDRTQADHWHRRSRRQAELIAAISLCIDATRAETSTPHAPQDVIDHIEQLITDFYTDITRPHPGGQQ